MDPLKITNPEKTFFPESLLTKRDIVSYYYLMAEFILPHVKERPLVLNRYPDGIQGKNFYQKEAPPYTPPALKKTAIYHEKENKIVNYLYLTDLQSLIWVINQGVIELHCWLSKIPMIENPDILVIDLDPEPPATFANCLPLALILRDVLLKLGIEAWPKTSGKEGLHLFVPIEPKYSFKETTRAVYNLCLLLEKAYPQKVTLERVINKRTGKVYLDYLQNSRGRTMAFPYSLRPLPGAPVSTPLFWEEVEQGNLDPLNFNLKTVYQRIKKYGEPWNNFHRRRYDIKPLLDLM